MMKMKRILTITRMISRGVMMITRVIVMRIPIITGDRDNRVNNMPAVLPGAAEGVSEVHQEIWGTIAGTMKATGDGAASRNGVAGVVIHHQTMAQ
jgi:hypothetical protein